MGKYVVGKDEDCVGRWAMGIYVPGKRRIGRPKRRLENVIADLRDKGLPRVGGGAGAGVGGRGVHDRVAWR